MTLFRKMVRSWRVCEPRSRTYYLKSRMVILLSAQYSLTN